VNTMNRTFLGVVLCGGLWTSACSRAEQAPPSQPSSVAPQGQAQPAPRTPAAASKATPAWPEDLPTNWFEAARDAKGLFAPVDCANRPLNQLLYREAPGGYEVVIRTPWQGHGYAMHEVQRTEEGRVELKLAPLDRKQASVHLVYQRKADGQTGWIRDGKPFELHPVSDLGRWRVRRVCIGSPDPEQTGEQEYVAKLLAKAPKPGQEFQGLPPKPKLKLAPWSGSLPEGLPTRWIELEPEEEKALRVGCNGTVLSSRLELLEENGNLILEKPSYFVYLVTQVKRTSQSVRLSLAMPVRGDVVWEVEIRHTPGAAEATWTWTTVADAEAEARSVLTLAAARTLPQRVVCQ